MKGLALFRKTNSRRSFNIASYHSPHSLTWSWILSLSFGGDCRLGFYPRKTHVGLQWVLRLPFMSLEWQRQREMWFRDMYRRTADERDQLERHTRRQSRLLAFFAAKDCRHDR